MGKLDQLQPKEVFGFFEEISGIPRGSENMQGISDYLVAFAKERGLKYRQDEAYNVIIWKDGTEGYETAVPVILQGHVDIVAVQDLDCKKDMEKEGLDLLVEGDFLTADGTSLGGDDGIAVAYMLALLDSDSIPHPPLEALFTTDEEIGLIGAEYIDTSDLKGKMFLNMDSEDEGVFTISCAGGGNAICKLPYTREVVDGAEIGIALTHFMGGHSGVEIQKGRLSANIALGRILMNLGYDVDYRIVSVSGGVKDNAIPTDAEAVLMVAAEDKDQAVESVVNTFEAMLAEYETVEPHAEIEVSDVNKWGVSAMTVEGSKRIASFYACLPDGVARMNPDIEGLVQMSSNLGIVRTMENEVVYTISVRSAMASEILLMLRKIETLTKLVGGSFEAAALYPGWAPRMDSRIRDIFVEAYQEIYHADPVVEGIHAGLECGLFAEKIEDLDAISIGPQMYDVHTTSERLSILSVERTWKLICRALGKMK